MLSTARGSMPCRFASRTSTSTHSFLPRCCAHVPSVVSRCSRLFARRLMKFHCVPALRSSSLWRSGRRLILRHQSSARRSRSESPMSVVNT